MNNKLIAIILVSIICFASCKTKDDEVGANKAPMVHLPQTISVDLTLKQGKQYFISKIKEGISDDYTNIDDCKIQLTPSLDDIDFTKVGETEIKGTVSDDGTNSLGKKDKVKSANFSIILSIINTNINEAPQISLPTNIVFYINENPTINNIKAIINTEKVKDDFTKSENCVITTEPKLEDINLTQVANINLTVTVTDDGTNSVGEINVKKSSTVTTTVNIIEQTTSLIEEGEVLIEYIDMEQWRYFSFEANDTVGSTSADKTRQGLDWDIAFHYYDIRLNGGLSGNGEGAALLVEGADSIDGWNSVVKAPDSGYQTDKKGMILTSAMPMKKINVSRSHVITGNMDIFGGELGTWVNSKDMPPAYTTTDQIFIIKTAKGNYCKIWLTFFNSSSLKMKYLIQKNKYLNDFQ